MKEKKKKIKTFGKILYVLAIICRVCLYISAVVIALCAIVIPILFSKVDITRNKVAITGLPDTKIEMYKDKTQNLNLLINSKKVDLDKELDKTERLAVDVVFNKLTSTTKEAVVGYLEAVCIFSIISMVLTSIAILNFERFCKSLSDKDVFTDDKPKYLRDAALFLIIAYVVSYIAGFAFSKSGMDISSGTNAIGIIEILVLYLAAYIFEYGTYLAPKEVKEIEAKEEKPKASKPRKTKKAEEK